MSASNARFSLAPSRARPTASAMLAGGSRCPICWIGPSPRSSSSSKRWTVPSSRSARCPRCSAQQPDPPRVRYRAYGWANINRPGDYNMLHVHPGNHWSVVYYVATGRLNPGHADERPDRAARSEPRGLLCAPAGVQHGPADADPAAGGHDARLPGVDRAQRAPVLRRRDTASRSRSMSRSRRDRHKAGTYFSSGSARSWKFTTFWSCPCRLRYAARERPE